MINEFLASAEDLTYSGRFLKVGMALIDIATIGVNAVINATAMGANEIGEDLGLPAGLRLILSKARSLCSIKGCMKVYID